MSVSEGTVLRVVAGILFPDNVVAQMVFHLVATDLAGGNDDDEVVADMVEYAEDAVVELVDHVADTLTADEVVVYEYDAVDEDFDEVGRDGWTVAFAAASEALPHGVAGVVNLLTIDPDVQGRKYVPGMSEGHSVAGVWSSGAILALAAFGLATTAPFTGTALSNVYQPVVWSPTNLAPFACTGSGTVSSIPGYQRRRKPGVGI